MFPVKEPCSDGQANECITEMIIHTNTTNIFIRFFKKSSGSKKILQDEMSNAGIKKHTATNRTLMELHVKPHTKFMSNNDVSASLMC